MRFNHVTCPHCGLLCDDLSIEVNGASLKLASKAYPNCLKAFEDASFTTKRLPSPKVAGKKASLDAAIKKAAKLLAASSQPLISGLITDIQGCREAVLLAEKSKAVIDHANGKGMQANLAVMQRYGKVKTTLSEVRNRSDLVIIFGSQIFNRFPRLSDRVLFPKTSLGNEGTINKQIIVIDSSQAAKGSIPKRKGITYCPLEADSLDDIIHEFLQVVNLDSKRSNGNNLTNKLLEIKSTILQKQYTTIVWNTGLFNSASAEQTTQSLTFAMKSLMEDVRCVGLPLGGSKAEITANQVSTWSMGVPLPVAFMGGIPEHDPVIYNGENMLQNGEADTLVWLSTYSPDDLPPKTDARTIVIGHPKMKVPSSVDVFIPVGIPGVDHSGLACRTDSVATLPLQKIRDINLPASSKVLKQIADLV
ncbi:MAG: hypothetical protein AAGB35_05810 [Pseudomonadota bacterium]